MSAAIRRGRGTFTVAKGGSGDSSERTTEGGAHRRVFYRRAYVFVG